MKDKIFTSIAIIAAIMLVSGATLMAAASSGSQNDPLVTLSYLTDVFKPQILSEITKTEQELTKKFDAQIAVYESGLQSGPDDFIPDMLEDTNVFSVVTIPNGKTLVCSVGTELMLRIGTAAGFGAAPALIDYTTGAALAVESPLVLNHMYLVTIEGNGVTASADLTRVLVRGNYSIK